MENKAILKEMNEMKEEGSIIDNALKEMNVDMERIKEDKEYRGQVAGEFKFTDKVIKWSDLESMYQELSKDILEQQSLLVGLIKQNEKVIDADKELFLLVKGALETFKDLVNNVISIRDRYVVKLTQEDVIPEGNVEDSLLYTECYFGYVDIREKFVLISIGTVTDLVSRIQNMEVKNGTTK